MICTVMQPPKRFRSQRYITGEMQETFQEVPNAAIDMTAHVLQVDTTDTVLADQLFARMDKPAILFRKREGFFHHHGVCRVWRWPRGHVRARTQAC